jgi:hypothetical protein
MARTQGWVWGFAFASFAGLALAAEKPAADKPASAEKRFALPAGESLVIKWNGTWTEASPPAGSPVGTVAFNGPDAAKMRVLIVPLPPNPNFTGDAGNLRILMRNMARELEESGGEVNPEHQAIEGQNVRGFYVRGVDHKPKPGEFSFIYAGPLSISSRAYVFQILWNTGGETAANAALAALRTVRIQ